MKKTESYEDRLKLKEILEKTSYRRNYEFYVFSGAIFLACAVISIIQMSEMPDADHGWMILGLTIAVLF